MLSFGTVRRRRFKFRRFCSQFTLLVGSNRTTLQNTNRSRVTVHYRFHPYAGQELEVIHYPVARYEWIMVRTPRGSSLKIPQWMVHRSASEIVISPNPTLSVNALVRLMELLGGPDLKGSNATVSQKEQEGQRATASTQSSYRAKQSLEEEEVM